ncbi:MAG: NAD(P)-dependent alcohol dehydrogenase [Fibrobacterota bacterium]|nr:MAG: NAD(P)-dependent alcohol dehydrogenase [Fibrobacterota bacterium]
MKAIVQSRYGGPDVFRLCDIPRPVPRQGEILVRVHATSVTSSEAAMRQGLPLYGRPILGLFRPRRPLLGLEFAGTVEECGPNAQRFAMGARVFGFTGFRCGAYAQFLVVSENDSVEVMPKGASFEEAVALVDGPTTALFFLHKARLRRGERVLVNGASGSIGTAAVQLVAWMGAEVTAVCSAAKHEQVRALGAHHLIDYHTEDFTQKHDAWDVVFDTVGKSSFCRCRRSLRVKGRYLSTVLGAKILLHVPLTALFCDKKAMFGMSVDKRAELAQLRELVEAGLHAPVIDRVFDLEQMAEAHAYVDSGRKRGNVVVRVRQDPK